MLYTQKSAEKAFRDIVRVNTPFNLLNEYFHCQSVLFLLPRCLKTLPVVPDGEGRRHNNWSGFLGNVWICILSTVLLLVWAAPSSFFSWMTVTVELCNREKNVILQRAGISNRRTEKVASDLKHNCCTFPWSAHFHDKGKQGCQYRNQMAAPAYPGKQASASAHL